MSPIDSCLQRLFRAAGRGPRVLPAEAPFLLEAQILAAWRRSLVEDRSGQLALVQRAFLCACAILMISAAVSFQSWTESAPSELVVVDSMIQLTLLP